MDGELSHTEGKILDIKNNIIKHDITNKNDSYGSPLIKKYHPDLIIGINTLSKDKNYNFASPFDAIINDIKSKINNNTISNKKNNNIKKNIKNNIINLIYEKNLNEIDEDDEDNCNNIFGLKFVENNKNNIQLIINGKKSELISKYNLKEGIYK